MHGDGGLVALMANDGQQWLMGEASGGFGATIGSMIRLGWVVNVGD